MRHLFCPPSPVTLLTDLVVQSACFGLLVQSAGGAPLLRPRQGSTRRAIAVATVAPPANHHLPLTTLAVENPAIGFAHPVSAAKRLYRDRRKSDAPLGASTATGFTPLPLSRSLKGVWGASWTPTPRSADAAISQSRSSRNRRDRRLSHPRTTMPTQLSLMTMARGLVMKGID
jgi:hypothetical protein